MSHNPPAALLLGDSDTIGIALRTLPAGEVHLGVKLIAEIPAGHKFALRDHAPGETILKYGQAMGEASAAIRAGDHVHSHNAGMGPHGLGPAQSRGQLPPAPERRSFNGILRQDGRIATRNFIGIIASVNCSSTVCNAIARAANDRLLPLYPNVDGFVPIVHDQGCGIATGGIGFELLVRVLKGYRDHVNFGGVMLVGLGCEVNQLTLYKRDDWTRARHASFNIQEVGGSRAAVARALEILTPIAKAANRDVRQMQPVSGITLGMQCGGSDGFSGITANPALGVASDLLVAAGGTSILSETPEIYGAEHLLIARASDADGEKLRGMIRWWEEYTQDNGASLDNNPSPGNKRGGITTILEKSLGAVAKGGRAPLAGVYHYAERIGTPGFVYMDSPGYDPVAATGQVAAGANLIAFTTGRGSCFGAHPAPSLKLASNSALWRSMEDDMDLDCGKIVEGRISLPEMGVEIYNKLLDTASGAQSKSELFGYGDAEFVPWRIGAVL